MNAHCRIKRDCPRWSPLSVEATAVAAPRSCIGARRSSMMDFGERETTLLQRLQDAPAHTLALGASGTILARDVEAAIEAASASHGAATGLIIVIEREFDGYFAELSRGLLNVSGTRKNLTRIAVITEADRMDEAKLGGLDASGAGLRLFPTSERRAAYEWAGAAPQSA